MKTPKVKLQQVPFQDRWQVLVFDVGAVGHYRVFQVVDSFDEAVNLGNVLMNEETL